MPTRSSAIPAICFFDLDHFKRLNDSHGHETEDKLLHAVGMCLRDEAGVDADIARQGGDEFVILKSLPDDAAAERLGRDISRAVSAFPLAAETAGKRSGIGASIGVVNMSLAPVSSGADAVDLRELLIRLPASDGDLITPDAFLDAAERYCLMSVIDMWMVRHCIERVRTATCGSIFTVNLSPGSMASRSFRKDLLAVIDAAPSEVCSRICLAITETSMVQNYADISGFLCRLRTFGVRIAIDDFGAGATSFRYFQDFPADYLKIDGCFIRNHADPVSAASLECFVKMAKVAGLETVTEHVEDAATIECLSKLGFDDLQGFVIQHPKPAA